MGSDEDIEYDIDCYNEKLLIPIGTIYTRWRKEYKVVDHLTLRNSKGEFIKVHHLVETKVDAGKLLIYETYSDIKKAIARNLKTKQSTKKCN